MRHQGLGGDQGARPDVYFSILHIPPMTPPILNVLARPAGDADVAALAPVLRQGVHEVAPRLPVYDVKTMAERLDEQVARDRFVLLLMSAFALLALGLAAVGLYGVLAYAVARQTREIGIRMALGAQRGEVIGRVLRRGVGLVGAGLLLGVGTAFALTRFLESLLHGLPATDPASFAVACVVLFGVALVASYLPARRAAKVDPVIALREE
jgi:ABC-type antimicrobial peptide transport system permease subunit